MTNYKSRINPWTSFLIFAFITAFAAALLFLPEQTVRHTAQQEREQMITWAGNLPSKWIGISTREFIRDFPDEIHAINTLDINQTLKNWLKERFYTLLIWYDVCIYRMFSVAVWFLLFLPFLIAASIDGYYLREIRKSMFTSQSPLRLKIGSVTSILSIFSIMTWLLIPIPVPVIIAPLILALMGFSCWIWTANLQKRI